MRDVLSVPPDMELLVFESSDGIPNNPGLPVIIHDDVAEIVDDPTACERLFRSHGWGGTWRNGIFPYHHFHSNAHEALGIVSGSARVTLGGPGGETLEVRAGDVLVMPAGTGHKREDDGSGLLVVGGYPAGQEHYDLRRGDPAELAEVRRNIEAARLPEADPVAGDRDGLRSIDAWIDDGSGSRRAADDRPQTADGRPQTADRRPQTAHGRRRVGIDSTARPAQRDDRPGRDRPVPRSLQPAHARAAPRPRRRA